MLMTLFDEEQIMKNHDATIRRESIEKGREEGREEGRNRLSALIRILFADGRVDDVKRVVEDPAYGEELMKEFKLA